MQIAKVGQEVDAASFSTSPYFHVLCAGGRFLNGKGFLLLPFAAFGHLLSFAVVYLPQMGNIFFPKDNESPAHPEHGGTVYFLACSHRSASHQEAMTVC